MDSRVHINLDLMSSRQLVVYHLLIVNAIFSISSSFRELLVAHHVKCFFKKTLNVTKRLWGYCRIPHHFLSKSEGSDWLVHILTVHFGELWLILSLAMG